jgi:hypothetical protein
MAIRLTIAVAPPISRYAYMPFLISFLHPSKASSRSRLQAGKNAALICAAASAVRLPAHCDLSNFARFADVIGFLRGAAGPHVDLENAASTPVNIH